jgi:hypothetical protein
VGRDILAAIETVFDWPVLKTTDYLNGDDAALAALPVRGPAIPLVGTGLTMDVVPAPTSEVVAWLRDLRTTVSKDRFFEVIDQLSRA